MLLRLGMAAIYRVFMQVGRDRSGLFGVVRNRKTDEFPGGESSTLIKGAVFANMLLLFVALSIRGISGRGESEGFN